MTSYLDKYICGFYIIWITLINLPRVISFYLWESDLMNKRSAGLGGHLTTITLMMDLLSPKFAF